MADELKSVAESADRGDEPRVDIIKRSELTGLRLAVFASSFNPPTVAHAELIKRAAEVYSLDETLALASMANADKLQYECSLEDRVAMLTLAFAQEPRISAGVSSHAFYVDMVDALDSAYPPQTDLHFVVGFDTFERVLDLESKYTECYHRRFSNRVEALQYLFARSSFIVAGRAGAGRESVVRLVDHEPAVLPERILYLDFPADLGEMSATEVRKRVRAGLPIDKLVPPAVEKYVKSHGLYPA